MNGSTILDRLRLHYGEVVLKGLLVEVLPDAGLEALRAELGKRVDFGGWGGMTKKAVIPSERSESRDLGGGRWYAGRHSHPPRFLRSLPSVARSE